MKYFSAPTMYETTVLGAGIGNLVVYSDDFYLAQGS